MFSPTITFLYMIQQQFDIYSTFGNNNKYSYTLSDTLSGEVLGKFEHECDAKSEIERLRSL